jgi:hypothetical protein
MAASEQDINRAKELAAIEEQRLNTKQKLNSLDADALSLASSLVDSIKEIQGISTKRSTFDQNILKVNKQIASEILGQKSGLSDIGSIQKQIAKNKELQAKAEKTSTALSSSLSAKQKEILATAQKHVKELEKEKLVQREILKNAADGNVVSSKAYQASLDASELAEYALEYEIEKLGVFGKQALFTEQNIEQLKTQNEEREAEIDKIKKINENLGITGAVLKGAEGFMDKIGLGALSSAMGFGTINKELDEYSASLEDGDEILSDSEKKQLVMGKSFELMGNAAKKALADPMVVLAIAMKGLSMIVTQIADGFKRFDETTGNIAKNLNLTNSEAREVSKGFFDASLGADSLFVSSKGLGETLSFINSSLGTSVVLSNEQLATFTKLRETAGLTNEELMGVQKLSLANGASFDDNADSLINQVNALNKSSGLFINSKEVLKDVSKLSASTTLSLGKNPAALAEAVTIAKSLGMEMSQIDAIAGSLLDFESSISNELEAELLLNKDINLEKARQAALNNDFATVAKEIAEQAGSSAEFTAMNRIQQEALAKAVGMSREDLAQTLFTQEAIAGASGDEAERRERVLNARIKEVGLAQAQKEAQEGGLQAMLDQATASERMEASMGKFSELSNSIGSIFAPIVDMFAAVAGWLAQSEVAMIIISGVISGLGALLAVLGVKAAVLAVKSVITAVASIFTGSASLGPFGIPLAIAGVGALVGGIAAATAVGDVNSPSIGKTQISTKEGGLLELSKNDDLVAFPGASKMMQGGQPTQTVQNNTVVENKTDMSATNALLAQLIKKTPEMAPLGMYEVQ